MEHQDIIETVARPLDAPDTRMDGDRPAAALPAAALAAGATALLAACGGGEDGLAQAGDGGSARATAQAVSIGATTKPSDYDAWRFLTQATFGPTEADIASIKSLGYVSWLNKQFNGPSRKTVDLLTAKTQQINYGSPLTRDHVTSALWDQFLKGSDQLRQRVAFALSEIFVISMQNDAVGDRLYCAASFHDLLARNAFGSFRTLVEGVCKHPAMGLFLSHINNRRPAGHRIPDQNFARELMQLFAIGLYELKMDGSVKLVGGQPMETYTSLDVEVMSQVFTGWSWQDGFLAPHNNEMALNNPAKRTAQTSPMAAYASEHSTVQNFPVDPQAGQVMLLKSPYVPSGNAETDLQRALDILLAHPNVAPFIARQMIQRLVTSNPSPLYVQRVATVFKASGFSMKSLVQAVLLDTEARDVAAVVADNTYGKLREPILRVTSFLRAFNATVSPTQGSLAVVGTPSTSSSALQSLGQSPLQSPSVFNFFRPGYMAPGSNLAQMGKVLPEMQLASETGVAAWVRLAEAMAREGFGRATGGTGGTGFQYTYEGAVAVGTGKPCLQPNYTPEFSIAANPAALVDAIALKLLGGRMSADLRSHLIAICQAITASTSPTPLQRITRVWSVVFLTLVSAEYIVQK